MNLLLNFFISTFLLYNIKVESQLIIDHFRCNGNGTIQLKKSDIIILSCITMAKKLYPHEFYWAWEKYDAKKPPLAFNDTLRASESNRF